MMMGLLRLTHPTCLFVKICARKETWGRWRNGEKRAIEEREIKDTKCLEEE